MLDERERGSYGVITRDSNRNGEGPEDSPLVELESAQGPKYFYRLHY